MLEFLETADILLKTFWYIAIPVTVIFFIQLIMTFAGADAGDGINADFDSNLVHAEAPFQLFSFRNLINFLLGFSWGGVSFYHLIENKALLILLAFGIGAGMVLLFFLVIQNIKKLSEDNSLNLGNAINKTGTVYIPVPGNKSGTGKIQISVNGSVHELEAITEKDRIESGALVRVLRVIDNKILLVEKI